MPTRNFPNTHSQSIRVVGILSVLIGAIFGILAGVAPIHLVLIMVVTTIAIYFFTNFEQAVLALLIVRSSLDVFSEQQIPAAFGIVLNVLTLIYVARLLLSRQKVKVDWFWYVLAGWIVLHSVWVILLPLGVLGSDASVLSDSIREWVRMFSWVMVYLLVMQLKDRLHPEKVISALFFSLIAPLIAALLQITVPPSSLPSFLVFESGYSVAAGSRMNGTLGHPNTFATFILLFLGLTLWKIYSSKQSKYWILLLGVLSFFLVTTSSLTGLMMLIAFIIFYLVPKFNAINVVSVFCLFALIITLFISSDLGQERLQSLYQTPLLNSEIDRSRAILLQWEDGNSFNWRIAQWTFLLQAWQKHPILGYGLATDSHVSIFNTAAHNDYIRFLVEEGVLGLTAFLAFLAAQFVRIFQILRSVSLTPAQKNLCLILLAYFVAILVGMLTGNILLHTTLFFYWWTLMAIAGWNWKQSSSEDKE